MIKSFAPDENIIAETKFKTDGVSKWWQNYLVQKTNDIRNRFGLLDGADAGYTGLGWIVQYRRDGENDRQHSSTLYTLTAGVWYIDAIQKQSSDTFKAIIYDTNYNQLGNSFTQTSAAWADETWTWVTWKHETTKGHYDWIRIRKYTSSEPGVSVNSQTENF